MIIFTKIRNIPEDLLISKGIREVICYNLSSYYNDVPILNLLIPSPEYMPMNILSGDDSIPEFDIAYGNYIIGNDEAFKQFMNLIVPAYTSPDTLVQILIGNSEYRDAIAESLMKLIQQRFGYNVQVVNDIEDFIYVTEQDFSIPGLFTLDQDLIRWRALVNPMGEYYE